MSPSGLAWPVDECLTNHWMSSSHLLPYCQNLIQTSRGAEQVTEGERDLVSPVPCCLSESHVHYLPGVETQQAAALALVSLSGPHHPAVGHQY